MVQIVMSFRRRHPLLAVLTICTLAWLPGFFTLPPLDRDESRFAQATRQMLESHDFVDIRLGNETRYQKPVGIYWLQAATTALFGGGDAGAIWTYRLPSWLGALTAVAATFWMVQLIAGADTAFTAALMLGLSVLLMSEAKIAKTDAALLGTICIAQAVLMRAYVSGRTTAYPNVQLGPWLALAGWAAFGLGVLIKGPVVAIVCGGTAAALVVLDRDWRWLKAIRPLAGIPVATLIILPWALAIGIASHGAFYEKSLGQDFALKLVGEQEAHGAPPGYYALLAAATFWPGTLLLLPALVHAWKQWRNPPVRFLLVWAVTTWAMFELVPTKLPHYVLPAYPALAGLCALAIKAWPSERTTGFAVSRYVSLALYAIVGVSLAVFLVVAPSRFGGGTPWWAYICAALAAAIVLSAIGPASSGRPGLALARAGTAAIALYAIAGFATAPRLTQLWLSSRMAAAVSRHAAPGDPPVVTAGYAEPSIQFLLGTRTILDDGPAAARAVARSGGLALVADDQRNAFVSNLSASGARAEALESIDGLNYSRGRKTRITLYRIVPAPD